MNITLKNANICELIIMLYVGAVYDRDRGRKRVLKHVYVKAKKMNRKLYLNKYGKLPVIEHNSWKEKDWVKELEHVENQIKCQTANTIREEDFPII